MNSVTGGMEKRLDEYFERIGEVLGNKAQRASFATYAQGILSDGERKSIEPISARACADPTLADAGHQRLLHFIGVADWSNERVRAEAFRYALAAITAKAPR